MNEIKLIETNGKTLLFVEVPENAKRFVTDWKFLIVDIFSPTQKMIPIPPGSWQILWKSTDLTEEQMKEICEKSKESTPGQPIYKDYVKDGQITKGRGFTSKVLGYDTPELSYLSLLEANGIVDRNKYGQIKPEYEAVCCDNWVSSQFDVNTPSCCMIPIPSEESRQLVDLWQEAQSQVKTYLILIKK